MKIRTVKTSKNCIAIASAAVLSAAMLIPVAQAQSNTTQRKALEDAASLYRGAGQGDVADRIERESRNLGSMPGSGGAGTVLPPVRDNSHPQGADNPGRNSGISPPGSGGRGGRNSGSAR